MKRLLTFGCSFTQYWRWPTWADALGRQYQQFENWGLCGAGNCYIFYSLMECHQKYHLGANDTVYIMWTNTSREDRYVADRWLEGGNVYWLAGNALGDEYIQKFACERGYLIRDLAVIAATTQLLDQWGCDWKFFSMVPLCRNNSSSGLGDNPNILSSDNHDVKQLYHDVLCQIGPSVYETLFDSDWNSRPGIPDHNDAGRRDFHPTPLEHVEYLDKILPGAVHDHTREWMASMDRAARDGDPPWQEPNRARNRL